ncbi:MAG: glycosyltransferase family 2 protein [Parachlamydiaceae bacterium]|nr:glycosyltransferase family 2 protein [Parachlamydiaceae bacterium]
MSPTIGVAVITHSARKHLPHCLPPFLNSPFKPRVLVVNSSSFDGTVEAAEALGAETLVVPRQQFNHGATRELARKYLGTDIVVMVTPDAYVAHSQDAEDDFLKILLKPLFEEKCSVAYARQIPHHGADPFESFSRKFNYPKESHIRSLKNIDTHGVYTFFCSNSCAAYINSALDEIGGFEPVLLGEDTVALARLLQRGHHVAYVAEATIHHSHRYSLLQEFRRSFDIGLARKEYNHLIAAGGKDTTRGKTYTLELTRHLWENHRTLLPYAFLQTLAKWSGYQFGKYSVKAPVWFKRTLSSQDFYWI